MVDALCLQAPRTGTITVLAMGDSEGFCGGSRDMCRRLPTPGKVLQSAEDKMIRYFWQSDGNCCTATRSEKNATSAVRVEH
jgi:hypothetical protein